MEAQPFSRLIFGSNLILANTTYAHILSFSFLQMHLFSDQWGARLSELTPGGTEADADYRGL